MIDPAAPASLHLRVQRLERDNRRFRLAACASSLTLLAWAACSVAPKPENVVSAERFVLLAADGTEGGALEFDPQGNPMLRMKKDQASVLLSLDGPGLLLRGSDGKTGAFMGIDSRGNSKVELNSERIMDGVRLAAHVDGSAGVYVLDPSGRKSAGLEAHSTGGSSLNFYDEVGRIRGQFGIDPQAIPNLVLLDERGARRMGMMVQEDGHALLEVEDEKGRPRALLTTSFDGSPKLELRRDDGQVSFEAP